MGSDGRNIGGVRWEVMWWSQVGSHVVESGGKSVGGVMWEVSRLDVRSGERKSVGSGERSAHGVSWDVSRWLYGFINTSNA